MQCARSNRDGNTVLGDVRESGITGLPLVHVGWKSKSLFIWSNDSLEQGKNDLTNMI